MDVLEISGYEPETTNNAMELRAAVEGLSSVTREGSTVFLVSDSAYLLRSLEERWPWRWAEGRHPERRPNWDLWQRLMALVEELDVRFMKVKGHSGDPENERVDKLAVEARHRGHNHEWYDDLEERVYRCIHCSETSPLIAG